MYDEIYINNEKLSYSQKLILDVIYFSLHNSFQFLFIQFLHFCEIGLLVKVVFLLDKIIKHLL